MTTTSIGKTDLRVSRLCLGTMTFGWTADEPTAFDIMDTALDGGITFFDTANIYSTWVDGNSGGESETIIGRWLAARGNRDRVVIATKVRGQMWDCSDGSGLSRTHIVRAVEDSLRRLQTDYIDLYQSHWYDENTPIEETLAAFDHLVQSGKVRAIGASNHPAWRLTKSLWQSDVHDTVRYESLQPHYNLLHRAEFETELRDLCADQSISVIPYSPLAAGFLTGKYFREAGTNGAITKFSGRVEKYVKDERAHDVMDVVREIASYKGIVPGQVALAWLMAQPTITAPIVGARIPVQIVQAAGAMQTTLTDDEITRLNTVSEGF
ncbi:MAG: aldo/keto reductase [Chloroflexota bacterium]